MARHKPVARKRVGSVPVPPDMPGVKGIFLGGCVATGVGKISKRRFPENAHAHCQPDDPKLGWVCFRRLEGFESKTIRMHELAHTIAGPGGHTDEWRQVMKQLGQAIPRRYRR